MMRSRSSSSPSVTSLLVAIAACAVLIRLLYVLLVAGTGLLSRWGASDAPDYHAIAQNLLSGRGFSRDASPVYGIGDSRVPRFSGATFAGPQAPTAYRPPLYPAFMALVYAVAGAENYAAVRVAQALLSGLAVFVVGWTAYRLSGSRAAGGLAALLLAANPLQIYFTGELLTETTFGVLVVGVLAFMALPPRRWTGVAIFGVVLGLAGLTRSTALALVPICAVALCLRDRQQRPTAPWRRAGARAAVLLAAVAVVVTPWAVRNRIVFGEWCGLTTNGGVNLALGVSREWTETIGAADLALIERVPVIQAATESQWSRILTRHVVEQMAERPWTTLRLVGRKWVHFFSPTLSDRHALPFRLVGFASFVPLLAGMLLWPALCWSRRSPDARTAYLLVCAAVLVFSLVHSLYITNVRFRVPIGEPSFAIFAADAVLVGLRPLTGACRALLRSTRGMRG